MDGKALQFNPFELINEQQISKKKLTQKKKN